jgi:hypothetical protein
MAITRSQLVKELEPGLNALFGLEYNRYDNEHAEIYATESSDRAFEEEVMLSGFAGAPVKQEGAMVVFDQANEAFTARYSHEQLHLLSLLLKKRLKTTCMTNLQEDTQELLLDLCQTQNKLKQRQYLTEHRLLLQQAAMEFL